MEHTERDAGERGAGERIAFSARLARALAVLLCLTAVAGGALAAWRQDGAASPAQAAAQEPAEEPAAPEEVVEEFTRETPRGTVAGFLEAARAEDWEEAALHLDFGVPGARRRADRGGPPAEERAEVAGQLLVVLERHVRLDLARFSDEPEGDLDDGARNVDVVGTVPREEQAPFEILLARVQRGADRVWLFSESTVAAIPELYADRGYGWIEELLPAYFFDVRFLTLELWQWIGLLTLVLAVSIASWILCFVAFRALRLALRAKAGATREMFLRALAGPTRLALASAFFFASTVFLHLPPGAYDVIGTACEMVALLAVAWFLLRCVDIAEKIVGRRIEAREPVAARTLVPMGRRVTKVFIVVIAGVSIANNLGFSVAGLVTTLGVGGLAVALAAQKPLENLFGAVMVLSDQPVRVGDFCRVGEHLGTIEDIGLRSTRLRTLDRTVVAIPNAEFAAVRLENYARRDRIWLHATLQFGYDTSPDQLRYLLVEIRRMLYAHPKIHPEPCRVRFVNFGAYSLDVEVFTYIATTDYNEFLAVKEDVQLRIMDIVEASGAYFAYPSQTLYLGRDAGRDQERTRETERRVEEWRSSERLPLPDFPEEEIRELDDTLEFPVQGSSSPRGAGGAPPAAPQGGASEPSPEKRRRRWRRDRP